MCCCLLFIHLFLLADNTNINLHDIYTSLQSLNAKVTSLQSKVDTIQIHCCTSLQSLHAKVDTIQTTVTQFTRNTATFPLQFQTVQPTTEPLHHAGPIYQPLLQTTQLHQTNLVPCLTSLTNEDLKSITKEDLDSLLSEFPVAEVSPVHSHQAEKPQPLPARTPGLSPLEKVMRRFPRRSVSTLRKLTIALALHVFGEDVMARSTISGRYNTAQFDQNKLDYIKTLVRDRARMSNSNFESVVWSKCMDSLKKKKSQMLKKKRLQATRLDQYNDHQ